MNCTALTRDIALRQFARTLLVGISALALSGCGSLGSKMPWSDSDTADYTLISSNLVDALSQYTRLNPLLATVQISAPDNAFEKQVHQEMSDRGYKLVKALPGKQSEAQEVANNVSATISGAGKPDDLTTALYVLTVGQVSAERQFQSENGVTLPISELTIRGGEERSVALNDADIFQLADASMISTVAFVSEPQTSTETAPAIEQILRPEVASNGAVGSSLEKEAPVKWNVYDTMESNYVSMFTEYEDVERNILVFPNDSLRLGDANKQIIEQYVSKMDPDTDVLSVIGCSHGGTDIDNGNSLLALGRANRVKEAFLFSGVEHEHVMDEGCWAPQPFDEVMPRRGVVLTLKRRKDS